MSPMHRIVKAME